MTRRVYLSLGSNVGDREAHLRRAIDALASWPEVERVAVSPVYRTAHVGPGEAPDYLNLCVALDGGPMAREILRRTKALERAAGRAADTHQRPRSLDIDLLLDGDAVVDEPDLRLPHPRMTERRFVLQPLADLDPMLTVPTHDGTVGELANRTPVAAQEVERVDMDLRPRRAPARDGARIGR